MTDVKLNKPCAVALGSFDGLHIGHRKVLESTLEFAKKHNLEAKIMLFDIHPREFIYGEKIPKLLTDEETEKMLKSMGFSIHRAKFSDIRNYDTEEFFYKVLIKDLNAKALCCGFNYSFGKFGKGNGEILKKMCDENGIFCEIIPPVSIDEVTVSSTAIRNFLINGETQKASQMLGRNYSVCSEVIHGDQRGRTLGFPTANQKIDESLVVPKYGVYETSILIDSKRYKGITNIGIRPTYRSEIALAETNILNFSGDIYGKKLSVELIKYIRSEMHFNSKEELQEQMRRDKAEVNGNV